MRLPDRTLKTEHYAGFVIELQLHLTPIIEAKDSGHKQYEEQRELEGIEEAIMTAESRAQELDALLSDPQFYVSRSQEAAGLIEESTRPAPSRPTSTSGTSSAVA